ncbi:small multidrug resistance pump [Seinonella peptonophila]|uniref:Small multidrug resistance pump n=1 Tax=Seinonella peptonophila TaxID=112248 RepID=A0A1M4T538_9BACL|nr:multidrug efflux SMR transporter [Seinonella peptonophila]SHE39524.1 small multidrug resistance pump [Seinonella peptonophila]
MAYVYLALAIIGELVGTTALKATEGFSKMLPSILVILGYGISFYSLSLSLKHFPLGMTYAIWAGLGTALTAIIGFIMWKESLRWPQLLGILLIIVGVILLNVFKKGTNA